jgi:hypothetical protein
MVSRCGRTVRADSIPTKILLAAHKDSAPDTRINFVNNQAKDLMSNGMIFKK